MPNGNNKEERVGKRPSKKIVPPLGVVEMSGRGVRPIIEYLGKTKEEIEASIIHKFAGALKHFESRKLTEIKKIHSHDFRAKEGDLIWDIELTDIVEPRHAATFSIRSQYHEEIMKRLPVKRDYLSGIDILIDDHNQNPRFPKASSQSGSEIIDTIISTLAGMQSGLSSLPTNRWFSVDLSSKKAIRRQLKLVFRKLETMKGFTRIGFSHAYSGTYQEYIEQVLKAIKIKYKKNYSKNSKILIMLVLYDLIGYHFVRTLRGYSFEYKKEMQLCREFLARNDHPFKQVYYFHPFPQKDIGHLVRIWQVRRSKK
jgi:hypothetical protein